MACSRGYDVVELARRGANATGLDLAPESVRNSTTAISSLQAVCFTSLMPMSFCQVEEAKRYALEQNVSNAPGTAHFVSGDYFTFKTDAPWVDIGYDFTYEAPVAFCHCLLSSPCLSAIKI